ncbi:hypothetical protein D9758_013453 [Tetrapyrgos nigripes]|uniref:Uncharacterized protein n=1 Tax=Tetrapyrgos nigripes TaxID=182062 RepID=A0A8H5CT37_9AGAR|nr:hypothetical protein D9758_013453 [Tetrapyrgos nigripes]
MSPRLFWFVVGAGAATWWHKHHDESHHIQQGSGPSHGGCSSQSNKSWGQGAPNNGGVGLSANPMASSNSNSQAQPTNGSWNTSLSSRIPSWSGGFGVDMSPPQATPEQATSSVVFEERKKIMDLGQHIGNTVSELSEATLDTLMSSAAALKAKLTEQRLQRERLEQERKQEEEYRRMNPPRYV